MRSFVLSLLGIGFGLAVAQQLDFDGEFNAVPKARSARGLPAPGKKGVFLMNRISPSVSTLYVANIDGTNERPLLATSELDYHATFSPDGEWIVFTTERNGDGNSDIYRVKPDGSGLEELVASPSFESGGVLSPDGKKLAFVSTANGYKTNIWVKDLETGDQINITNTATVAGNASLPDGYFRPAWSPDGEWLAFSSDRNTAWRGHSNGSGWEHTQELSIYAIRPDGSDFREVATKAGYCLGSPKWSPDGSRIVYYEMTTEDTYNAHGILTFGASVNSQIVSVDFATSLDRVEETSGTGLKMWPQYISDTEIGYLIKAGANAGLNYTSGRTPVKATIRSPAWSPDGKSVVYEKQNWTARAMESPLYSWDSEWDYRFTDVFPQLSKQGKLVITSKQLGDSSIVTMNPDGSDWFNVFDPANSGNLTSQQLTSGTGGAFQPGWSPDGEWITFGLGIFFQGRATGKAYIVRATSNGSFHEVLTDGTANSGFPSYSADGRYIAYREWGVRFGIKIIDLQDKSIRSLTNDTDNLPFWSPDGEKIVFTRRTSYTNYDIGTIRPDGTDLQILTESGANDAHAVWTADGRIMYCTGMYGFQEEAATYDNSFQPYGHVIIMNADGSNKTALTDSMWEDSMPLYLPNEVLA